MQKIQIEKALEILKNDEEKIKNSVKQQSTFCVLQCKAFEEIIDTQVFGFSKEVSYAVRIGLVGEEEGNKMVADLEQSLNQIYTDAFEIESKRGGSIE